MADTNEAVIGAIRLALAGATNDSTAVGVIIELVALAPETDGGSHAPVSLLMKAVRNCNGKVAVNA